MLQSGTVFARPYLGDLRVDCPILALLILHMIHDLVLQLRRQVPVLAVFLRGQTNMSNATKVTSPTHQVRRCDEQILTTDDLPVAAPFTAQQQCMTPFDRRLCRSSSDNCQLVHGLGSGIRKEE